MPDQDLAPQPSHPSPPVLQTEGGEEPLVVDDAYLRQVYEPRYGRPLSEEEVGEIDRNLQRLAEVFLMMEEDEGAEGMRKTDLREIERRAVLQPSRAMPQGC